MLTFGSLFAGIGGMDLGLERSGMRCAWQVEIDDYATRVLAKHWPDVARFRDVRDVGAHNLAPVDVIAGGFPCQDISVAGRGAGITGARSGLWSEFARIIGELRPRYVIVENVAALLGRGMGTVLGDLSALGYDAEWEVIPALAVGAPHRRDRVFIVAYARHEQSPEREAPSERGEGQARGITASRGISGQPGDVADPESARLAQRWDRPRQDPGADHQAARPGRDRLAGRGVFGGQRPVPDWAPEPAIQRMVDGVPNRLDRLRGLGNAVVPQVAEFVGRCVMAHAGYVPVGAHLAVYDPAHTAPGGYPAHWRVDAAPGGPAWFGSVDGVRAWVERMSK